MTFYVYQLVDPRDGLPFYVGKGKGRRAWDHQRGVERGVVGGTPRKVDKIRDILKAGFDVEVQILADYDSEEDALDHEWRLINSMPTLTNVVEGGSGRSLTPEQVEKRKRLREEREAAERAKSQEARRSAFINQNVSKYAGGRKSSRYADEVRDWLNARPDGDVLPNGKLRLQPPKQAPIIHQPKPRGRKLKKGMFGRMVYFDGEKSNDASKRDT